MKIAVPWPSKPSSCGRIKEALDLWENKERILICLPVESNDPFLRQYDTVLLKRNSNCIGGVGEKCFIADMIQAAVDGFPNEDWYAFCNSDCIPIKNVTEGYEEYESIVYHRTDIYDWEQQLVDHNKINLLGDEIVDLIMKLRSEGMSDKKISSKLKEDKIKVPVNHSEWTYDIIKDYSYKRGEVFFWGQDMFAFRSDVVEKVLSEYLNVTDPISGTGGFDPKFSRWLMTNLKSIRSIHRLFHKRHKSEWSHDEVEYNHNGGDDVYKNRYQYYNHEFVSSLKENGYNDPVPRHVRYMIKRNNPNEYNNLFSDQYFNENVI